MSLIIDDVSNKNFKYENVIYSRKKVKTVIDIKSTMDGMYFALINCKGQKMGLTFVSCERKNNQKSSI